VFCGDLEMMLSGERELRRDVICILKSRGGGGGGKLERWGEVV
jgi:hypothetical protein